MSITPLSKFDYDKLLTYAETLAGKLNAGRDVTVSRVAPDTHPADITGKRPYTYRASCGENRGHGMGPTKALEDLVVSLEKDIQSKIQDHVASIHELHTLLFMHNRVGEELHPQVVERKS